MSPDELLKHINTRHQTTFALQTKYPDGEQGAFLITDHSGQRWVLKWATGARNLPWMQGVKTVTDLLRGPGYPVPAYLLIEKLPEGIYSIQTALPGAPQHHLAPELLPRLFELNELQIGRAVPDRQDWHQEVIDTVLLGGENYCFHEAMQQHSPETASLLHAIQDLVRTHQDEPHRTEDIVHGDFQQANILIANGQISGIVDWDGFAAGDCSFDIATLLFYSYDTSQLRERLWEYALKRASLNLLSIYLAHLILRQVDWSLRYHDHTISERYIVRAQKLLREIEQRSHAAH
jgi:Phosphotransferase enzyme family